jgi:Flp pilus assembly protein TadD
MEEYPSVEWKSALGLKRALVAHHASTKTPGLSGEARVQELQKRLLSVLKLSSAQQQIQSARSDDTDPGTSRSSLYDDDGAQSARSAASVGYTPRDVQAFKTVGEIRQKLTEAGLSTRTPGLRGAEREQALRQRLVDGHDGGLSSARSTPSLSARCEPEKRILNFDTPKPLKQHSERNGLNRRHLEQHQSWVKPPLESPPETPQPPAFPPPPSGDRQANASAMYWSGWNDGNPTVATPGNTETDDAIDDAENNSEQYEQAYAELASMTDEITRKANISLRSSQSVPNMKPTAQQEPSKKTSPLLSARARRSGGLRVIVEDNNRDENRTASNFDGVDGVATVVKPVGNEGMLSSHMGHAWGTRGRPTVGRGDSRRRGGGFTRGALRGGRGGGGARGGRAPGLTGRPAPPPTAPGNSCPPVSSRLNSRMEALSNAHEAILAEYTAKKELCDELRQAIQQLKEDSAGVRASRDATCAERSDPACSSKLAKMVERLSMVRGELERAYKHKEPEFDTQIVHGNIMQRFPTRVAADKLEAVERQIDNDIDVFCTKIVKEEEQSEKHGLAVEKDILRTIEKTKRKLEMAEKERKACEVQEDQARKRLDAELERRSARPPFSGPDAVKDPWKLCQNATFLWRIRGEDDTAQRVFLQALSRSPDNANILHAYSEFLHENKRDHVKAAKLLQKALSSDSKHVETLALYGHILQSVMSSTEEAETLFLKCLEIAPTHAKCLTSYALLLASGRMDFEAAERLFKQARRHSPKDVQIIKHYARFLQKKRGDYNGAEKLYKEAMELDPCQPKVLSAYANFLMKVRGDYPRAERLYGEAITLAPRSATTLGNMGNFFQRIKGNPAAAQEYYLKAMEYEPDHPGVKRNYAILLRDFPELRTPSTETMVSTPAQIRQRNMIHDAMLRHDSVPSSPGGVLGSTRSRSRSPGGRSGRSRSPGGRHLRSKSPGRRSRSPGGRRSQSPARLRRLASRGSTPGVSVQESSLAAVEEATPRTEAGLRTARDRYRGYTKNS